MDALADALTLACAQGYVRVFADEGAPMRACSAGWSRPAVRRGGGPGSPARLPGPAASRVRRAAHRPGRSGAAALPGLVEPLTAREVEVEVLGRLAEGQSNQRIAEELVVTVDTVKKHVSHVVDELGAANRTEAVARARQLGLIG